MIPSGSGWFQKTTSTPKRDSRRAEQVEEEDPEGGADAPPSGSAGSPSPRRTRRGRGWRRTRRWSRGWPGRRCRPSGPRTPSRSRRGRRPRPARRAEPGTGAAFGLKMQTMASPKATNRAIQDQPGNVDLPLVVLRSGSATSRTTPPARRAGRAKNVLAKAPFAVMWATRVGGGAPVASACASSTGCGPARFVVLLDRLEALLVQRRIGHDVAFPARRLRGSSVRDARPSTCSMLHARSRVPLSMDE